MLRNVSTLWLNVLLAVGIFLTVGVAVQGYQKKQRAYYESRRQTAMRQVIERAQPLIARVRAYEKQHHKPPQNLDALERTFSAPGPVAKYGWEYAAEGDRWTLAISVDHEYTPNNGFLTSADTFVFRSDGEYPQSAYGGVLERVGAWGYYWY